VRRRLRIDLLGGVAAGAAATLVIGAIEIVAVLVGGSIDASTAAGFALVGLALTSVIAIIAGVSVGVCVAVGRAALGMPDTETRDDRWPALLADEPGRIAARVHGVAAGLVLFVAGVTATNAMIMGSFRDVGLMSLSAAAAAVVWLVAGVALAAALGRRLASVGLGPLSGPRVAAVAWLGVAWAVALVAMVSWQPLALAFPFRLALSATAFVVCLLGLSAATPVLAPRLRRARVAIVAGGVALVVVAVATLGWFPVADDARRAVLRSPTLRVFLDTSIAITDVDRDGHSSILAAGDCAPFDGSIHPGARDIASDGIDQNCSGADYVPSERPSPFPDAPLTARYARDDFSILVVTIDTLRYDHVGFAEPNGHSRPTTPALDALASRSAVFDLNYSTGRRTYTVFPSMVTSMFPEEIPVGDPRPPLPGRIDPMAVTLAEVLSAAGRRSAMFTAHWVFDGWGVDQGFGYVQNGSEVVASGEPGAKRIADSALEWLERVPADERWFLWAHFVEPHLPYERHGYEFSGDRSAYDEEIRLCDDQLGRLLDWVNADEARRARTIVIVTSDHGEAFGEHGQQGHGNGPLYQMLIRVPLVIHLPGAPAQRVNGPVSVLDIAPTIVALAGVDPEPKWTGLALVSEVTTGVSDPSRVVFATDPDTGNYAAMTTGWKLLRSERHNVWQLVDLGTDPGEERDASDAEPDRRAALQAELTAWRERIMNSD
jgi:arylsulfatase A-like enzyme